MAKPQTQRNRRKRGGRDVSLTAASGRKRKLELTFDPESRRQYLTGFSTRKKERRAFGLAMQKVKDRQSKLEERKDARKARMEQVREMERQKRIRRGEDVDETEDHLDGRVSSAADDAEEEAKEHQNEIDPEDTMETAKAASSEGATASTTTTTFEDTATQSTFGGTVVVTTTYGQIPDSDDEAEEAALLRRKQSGAGRDEEQRYAGNVQKYVSQIRGSLPGKKHKKQQRGGGGGGGRGGKHGAADMKGMGGAANLKAAQKTLARYRATHGGDQEKSGKKRKGGKGKGRR